MPRKADDLRHPERPTEIGQRLKGERERLHLTHAWLEKKTGVKRFSIGRFESGSRGMDSDALLLVLFALAEAGARLDYIILGRSSAAKVTLDESAMDALTAKIRAALTAAERTKRHG